ncbi:MAG: hypothetical protein WC359_12505 [Dehalococcoidia bacterium]|jgi:hypothetical protein
MPIWTKVDSAVHPSGKRYVIWRRWENGVAIYNATCTDAPPAVDDGGYPNKEALFRLKNITCDIK